MTLDSSQFPTLPCSTHGEKLFHAYWLFIPILICQLLHEFSNIWHHFHNMWGVLEMVDPQVTMAFNIRNHGHPCL